MRVFSHKHSPTFQFVVKKILHITYYEDVKVTHKRNASETFNKNSVCVVLTCDRKDDNKYHKETTEQSPHERWQMTLLKQKNTLKEKKLFSSL